MHKVAKYLQYADHCRNHAAKASEIEEKKALEGLAAAWELLARTREKQIENGALDPFLDSP